MNKPDKFVDFHQGFDLGGELLHVQCNCLLRLGLGPWRFSEGCTCICGSYVHNLLRYLIAIKKLLQVYFLRQMTFKGKLIS